MARRENNLPPRSWRTIDFERTVLVVVRTVTTLTRLLDILSLVEHDRRVQVLFTRDEHNPAVFAAGVAEFLAALGAPVISWRDATERRFDLAIAASENDALHELDAPVVLVPHGIGYQKYYPGGRVTSGMNPARLVRDGRVVPAAIALSHDAQRAQLAAACPEAVGRSVVIGDPCHDRMRVSAHRAPHYRRVLGTGRRRLVVLASTWGPHSLFGSRPELAARLVGELPVDEYQVAAILHPGVWAGHGRWQVRAWLGLAMEAGLVLVPPERGWQAAVLAADCVLGDAGSASLYAASVDRPVLLGTGGNATTVAESPLARLTRTAAVLDDRSGLREQVDGAIGTHRPGQYDSIVASAVADPGRCAESLTGLLYGFLDLDPPGAEPEFPPVADPVPDVPPVAAYVVGGRVLRGGVSLVRFPVLPGRAAPVPPAHRHLVADAERATLRQLESAAIVYSGAEQDFPRWAADTLRLWPDAAVVAVARGDGCRVRTRSGLEARLRAPGADPLLLASLFYLRPNMSTSDVLEVGGRRFEVVIETADG